MLKVYTEPVWVLLGFRTITTGEDHGLLLFSTTPIVNISSNSLCISLRTACRRCRMISDYWWMISSIYFMSVILDTPIFGPSLFRYFWRSSWSCLFSNSVSDSSECRALATWQFLVSEGSLNVQILLLKSETSFINFQKSIPRNCKIKRHQHCNHPNSIF